MLNSVSSPILWTCYASRKWHSRVFLNSTINSRRIPLITSRSWSVEGYCYSDLPAITPYLETPKSGPTFQFCSSLAQRLACHVVAGFPERIETEHGKSPLAANSALVIAPDGSLKTTYRKTNLFEMDVPWAQPGQHK